MISISQYWKLNEIIKKPSINQKCIKLGNKEKRWDKYKTNRKMINVNIPI